MMSFTQLGMLILTFVLVTAFVMLTVLFLVFFERRLLALFTVRYGPNRVGYNGLLQTAADAIKLLCKEDVKPDTSDKFLFFLAPLLAFCPVLIIYFFIPFSKNFIAINSPVGIILFCAISTLAILGIFLGGYASNNKFSLLGAFRSVSQAISFEIPILMCILAVAILGGSFNLNDIVQAQGGGMLRWFFIPSMIGFFVFFTSMLAELNRTPFDFYEAESELVGGYNVEYSGMKFAMFFLAEYALFFVLSAFFVTIFLGGYQTPFAHFVLPDNLVFLEHIFWLFLKIFLVIFFVILIRASLPRFRTDKLLDLSYKILVPASIINLILAILCAYARGAM